MRINIRVYLTLIILIFDSLWILHHKSFAKETVIQVVGEAVITGALTFDQAKIQAINRARIAAIENAAGIHIVNSSLIVNEAMSYDFIKTLSSGYIIREKIVNWIPEWVGNLNSQSPPYPKLTVMLDATVKVPKVEFMRSHVFDASLNRVTYRSGELAKIEILPKEDVYILIVNYTSKDNVISIFPNKFSRDNLLKSGKTFVYPDSGNISIEMHTYPGRASDSEAFFVFAIPVDAQTKKIDWVKLFPNEKQFSYVEFHSRLLQLPMAWMGEKVLVYRVYKH